MAAPMSDEELYQLTGSWEAAAALRDEQATQNNSQTVDTSPAGITALPNNLTNNYTKNFAGQDYTLDNSSVDKLAAQILAQNTSSKWTGEGWGSAQANARAMAENLLASGVTDINQVGKKTITTPGYTQSGDGGDTEVAESSYDQLVNKITGKQLINDYAERGGVGNAWSGTYTGKGNTAYNVQFDSKGNPVFYTTGASSNDLVNFLGDDPILNAVAQVGASYFGGPAGTAALNVAMGKDFKDVAKSTLLSYLGNEAFKGFTDTGAATNTFGETGANFAKDIKDVLGETGSKILGKTAGQYVGSGGKIDPVQALINGGIGAGTSAVLDQIPDFKTMDPFMQKMVTKVVTNSLSGGPNMTPEQLISSALTEGLKASKGGGNLTSEEQTQIEANRETKRLNRIEDAVLNQPASDDGTTQGILDLINEMYPAANVKGMSQGDLSKFLEANINDIQGSAELETLLRGQGQTTADEGTVTVTGDRPVNLDDFINLNNVVGNTSNNYADDTVFVTDDKDKDYVSSLRTKEIKSDIPDELTKDDIEKLFPDIDVTDILQTVTPGGTTTVVPNGTKTVVPGGTKTTTPGTKTTQETLANLGLNAPMPSQDPYANIKSMEELFGGDIGYKLRALGVNPNQKLASSDMDELVKLLRG